MKEDKTFRNPEAVLDVQDKPKFGPWLLLSIQHLFTMFGSTVLVPLLIGLKPSIALFCSGVGTLVYILCTQAKIPAYLGSSFAFIATMQALMKNYGYPIRPFHYLLIMRFLPPNYIISPPSPST